jgi:hypothetical protein
MTLYEKNPEEWVNRYIHEIEQHVSKNMRLGSVLADSLESGEATGDPVLDLMASKLTKYELRDQAIMAKLPDKKRIFGIKILIKPDTCKKNMSAIIEYKSSVRQWTQKMADESARKGQTCYYAMGIWLITKKIPDIKFQIVETEYSKAGRVQPTGRIYSIQTKTTLPDIIRMTARARRAWAAIEKLCEEELF